MKRLLQAGLLALLAALPAAASEPGEDEAGYRRHVEHGRAVWNFRCYFCHGYSGDARTLAATFLHPSPRNFQATDAAALPVTRLVGAVRDGVPGTSMKGFRGILTDEEIAAVAAFVRSEFLERRDANTRYHTAENGWPGHERYRDAFPFARGEIALDRPESRLNAAERKGRRLFLSTCITCHDRAQVTTAGPDWQRVR